MTMRSCSCVMRLTAPSNTQSKMMLVGRQRRRGLSCGDHIWNASASALPRAVNVTGRGPQPDGGTSLRRELPGLARPRSGSSARARRRRPAARRSRTAPAPNRPRCSARRTGRRGGRFDVSTDVVCELIVAIARRRVADRDVLEIARRGIVAVRRSRRSWPARRRRTSPRTSPSGAAASPRASRSASRWSCRRRRSTSKCRYECGLTKSMPLITPVISTGFVRSKRPRPWCASAAVETPSNANRQVVHGGIAATAAISIQCIDHGFFPSRNRSISAALQG